MSPFNPMAIVEYERFQCRFDLWDDGPYVNEYRLDGFRVSEQRIPDKAKDELHRLAWDAWRSRGRHYDEDDDYEC